MMPHAYPGRLAMAADSLPRSAVVQEKILLVAVRSARLSIETLCEPCGIGPGGRALWDTRRLQRTHDDRDYRRLDWIDVREAVECLELLGLLERPVVGCPHLVVLSPEIERYEIRVGRS